MSGIASVPDRFDFPKEEEKILKFWNEHKIFEKSLELSRKKPRYSFYDGPPFATGLPHYGHILAGTIKDIVTRWASMTGYYVERRFGWDCHGLPVEYEIDKTLGIKSPEDVKKLGIENYNAECRKIVMRYSKEWETIVKRIGRWIDFEHDYKTMYPWFMETVWWVFSQLYQKGMVYRGFKVMPYSTGCSTPLSNFEAGQNYKDVQDPAVIVSFPIISGPDKGTCLLAWTTTPWTLPSNLSLCVNPNELYVKILDKKGNGYFILMEKRLEILGSYPYEVVGKPFAGSTLAGLKYEPLFPYFSRRREESGAFRVLVDGYVTDSSGTGIVHQAPYFGEDDYRVCLANGIISRDGEITCPVDETGKFTSDVTDFSGLYVKTADPLIIKYLNNTGRMIDARTSNHSYPYCWRSNTPLIYKAVPSWFVRVESIVDKLLENNQKTYWVPEFVKDKRFANWLRDARDWAISRNRYWGTPLPLWVSDDGEEVVCIGSIAELEKLTGQKITDIHRESVDSLTIPSRCGKGELKRVTEVFDCWFESGSMPYAQQHYPFENKKEFEDSFPADFVAEGTDQTRGWFYTLLVLSTALFGEPPFKNLICNGLILAEDGSKMSKSKKNYPEPTLVMNSFGADAVRLYLINSPAVRGDSLKFVESGVRDVLKDVFLPWYNAYRFLVQNIQRLETDEGLAFIHDEANWAVTEDYNYMDRWILSFTQSLIKFVRQEMSAYRLYTVVPRLIKFVVQLTNWYVRMNRRRIKGQTDVDDCRAAVETLFVVIYSMMKVMGPFTPFLADNFYQNLKHCISGSESDTESIHFLDIPTPREELIDIKIERAVSRMQDVIDMGRIVRERNTLPVKYPLLELVVVNEDPSYLSDVKSLESYIVEELNIKTLTVTNDKSKFRVTMKALPDQKVLGIRLKKQYGPVGQAIQKLTESEIVQLQNNGKMEVAGHMVDASEIRITYDIPKGGHGNFQAIAEAQTLVILDCTKDESSESEGLAREVTNRIQKLRKKAGLEPRDNVIVYYQTSPDLAKIIASQYDLIYSSVQQPIVNKQPKSGECVIIAQTDKVKSHQLHLTIAGHKPSNSAQTVSSTVTESDVKYCIAQHNGHTATIILERPVGSGCYMSHGVLVSLIKKLFDLSSVSQLYNGSTKLTLDTDISSLTGCTLSVNTPTKPSSKLSPATFKLVSAGLRGTFAVCTENPIGKNKLLQNELIVTIQSMAPCGFEVTLLN